jgi:hypothetical protein
MKSRTYFIPANYRKEITFDEVNAEVYYTEKNYKFCAVGFSGKRTKPDFRYQFISQGQRSKYITDWIAGLREKQQRKNERRKALKEFCHTLKVGDIICSSWGYDQTNVSFYQVTRIVSKKSVEIREIQSKIIAGYSSMSADVIACAGEYIGETMIKRVALGNRVKINSCEYCNLWDGTQRYCSWYA